MQFSASGYDMTPSLNPITSYELYRLDDGTTWTLAGSVAANEFADYEVNAPTLLDSTIANGQNLTSFKVRAISTTPPAQYESTPLSGYSVDNLAPGAPTGVAFYHPLLSWNPSDTPDFDHFTVYGSNTTAFEDAVVIDHVTVAELDVSASLYPHFFVTATDVSGNEGLAAFSDGPTGIDDAPRHYILSVSNYPNPFNPRTTVSYTVPSRGRVTVAVFDARGAHVATLFDGDRPAGAYSLEWNGLAAGGAPVSSGVYFARIEHNGAVRSKKMVLLK